MCRTLSVPQQTPPPSSLAPPSHTIRRSVAAVSSAIPWCSSTRSASPTKNSPAPHDWTSEAAGGGLGLERRQSYLLYQVTRRGSKSEECREWTKERLRLRLPLVSGFRSIGFRVLLEIPFCVSCLVCVVSIAC